MLLQLGFPPAPVVLGFVLGPRLEDNFRRALLVAHGNVRVFLDRPISATFLAIAGLFVIIQVVARWRALPPIPKTIASGR